MKAYWFEPSDGKLGYDDGRKPRKGETHKVKCAPVLCNSGLHASPHPFDALQYAQSSVLWLVELGGEIVQGNDKCAATERKYIKRVNVENVLRQFARECALENIEKAKPYFSAEGWVCCTEYLRTGDASIRSAAASAALSARVAAWSTAYAGSAALSARVAAWSAAYEASAASAAWSAMAAARSAALYAATERHRARLAILINEAFDIGDF